MSSDYNRNYLFARSTDVDRTLVSAQAFLSGLYGPYTVKAFYFSFYLHVLLNKLGFKFIPIHTAIGVSDPVFKSNISILTMISDFFLNLSCLITMHNVLY